MQARNLWWTKTPLHWLRRTRESSVYELGIAKAEQLVYSSSVLRLDLGSGGIKRPGFIRLDLCSGVELQWDLKWGIPFPDESVVEIRSDHFFEHLELIQVVDIFRECWRVLVSGGLLDFTVPHIDPYLDAYLHKDLQFFLDRINDIPPEQKEIYSTCFDRLVWLLCRAGEHKSVFDSESIVAKLALAGFTDIRKREYDPLRDCNPRFSSIYVVARK